MLREDVIGDAFDRGITRLGRIRDLPSPDRGNDGYDVMISRPQHISDAVSGGKNLEVSPKWESGVPKGCPCSKGRIKYFMLAATIRASRGGTLIIPNCVSQVPSI